MSEGEALEGARGHEISLVDPLTSGPVGKNEADW
jgi:hypothetical protein